MPITRDELSSKRDFTRKLGYYIAGIAIGFALLGVIQKMRASEHAARERERAERAAQPSGFPEIPELPAK